MTLIAPRRPVRTCNRDGREVYIDTGRAVDEQLGSHVVLWIVDDPELWAKAIEVEGDAEAAKWPKKDRALAEHRRSRAYESADQVRADGPGRSWYAHYHDAESAHDSVASLRRSHPNPGVRYEVAEITATGACPDCHQPMVQADGQWRHHTGRYPAECAVRPEREPEPERQPGEWEINIGRGSMICGYCDEDVAWGHAILGYVRLTGYHLLGIHRESGDLVVLAEATTLSGATDYLPHHCDKIPDEVRAAHDCVDVARQDAGLPR